MSKLGITNLSNLSKLAFALPGISSAERKRRQNSAAAARRQANSRLVRQAESRLNKMRQSTARQSSVRAVVKTKAPSPIRRSPPTAAKAYEMAYENSMAKTATAKWQTNAMKAARAFKAAGLSYITNKSWVNSVRAEMANYAGLNAKGRVQGMGGRGHRRPMPGSINYVNHKDPMYTELSRLLSNIRLRKSPSPSRSL